MNCSASPHLRSAILLAGLTIAAPTAAAQQPAAPSGPVLHAAIAASEHRREVPAIAWLCEEFLPGLPQWPAGLDPQQPFAISLSVRGIEIRATEVKVPTGTVALGTCSVSDARSEAATITWHCDVTGRERWSVPNELTLPHTWHNVLRAIEADLVGTARTLSVPVVAGHLAGGMADGDPGAAVLRICPTLCGDATWMASIRDGHLEVCGKSGGGLMLPAAIFAMVVIDGGGNLSSLSMRAFASRDADQTEAARQLGRSDRTVDVATLRSLLRGEDPVRLTAIESLVRHGQSQELVHIIAAAHEDKPWATIAARDAVVRLWPATSSEDREAVRTALRASDSAVLQELATSGLLARSPRHDGLPLATNPPLIEPISDKARLLMVLFVVSIGLFGLWLRERAALHPAAR